ncbi:2,3-diphosphoglycerate-dependent phosphoglycerate mutase [Methanosarcina sp. KYL-1]|uniref:histidine phosphatase family protein n=1 Tax=Methanosarcina sp. KYL-1 TaxID=2602068 RepID=UPI002100F31E|nr:2,3-diphosphoglycerate-dependent phosphoglycerate mutase [Methanosarcina sp. KYL-1]MCQ1535710.1 2,3-diphosphoglycerate-dependent phosphoglycerate mutase [Methanosarcina sp. KYL-1]
MTYLVLVRHGEARLNLEKRFAGWLDTPLTEGGIEDALRCALDLEGIDFDLAFTSKLIRARETLFLILSKQKKAGFLVHEAGAEGENAAHREWYSCPENFEDEVIPIHSSEALNERYYGILQGKKKKKMKEKYGDEQIFTWCRSFETGPPEGESLKDISARAVPFFEKEIFPAVKAGKNVIICAHQNSLRALIKHIENISDEEIPSVALATATPLIYGFSEGKLVKEKR